MTVKQLCRNEQEYLDFCQRVLNPVHYDEIGAGVEGVPARLLAEALYHSDKHDNGELQMELEEKYPDDWEERMAAVGPMYTFDRELYPYSFPLVVVGAIAADHDRQGSFTLVLLHFVQLADFRIKGATLESIQ